VSAERTEMTGACPKWRVDTFEVFLSIKLPDLGDAGVRCKDATACCEPGKNVSNVAHAALTEYLATATSVSIRSPKRQRRSEEVTNDRD
jgi:hypothetical protein